VTAPRTGSALASIRGAQTEPVEAADAVAAVASWHAPVLKRDAITLSARAAALVRAGLAVRAYVMAGWENVRRLVTLSNGQSLVLEYGLYGTTTRT
jgi:hypothetical protein